MGSTALPSVSATASQLTVQDLFAQHAAFVLRVVRRLGASPADAEDVAQEVFLVVHRKLHTYDGSSNVRTWLFGITRRVVADHRKRVQRRRETEYTEHSGQASGMHPEAALQKQELLSHLDRALEQLSESKRVVFVLYEMECLPMNEIAEMVGCPVFTAYSRLREARETLAAYLARRGHGEVRR